MWRSIGCIRKSCSRWLNTQPKKPNDHYYSRLSALCDDLIGSRYFDRKFIGDRETLCKEVLELFECVLSSSDIDTPHTTLMKNIMMEMRGCHIYNESAYDRFSHCLSKSSKEIALENLGPPFAFLCCKLGHFNSPFLESIADYLINNHTKFTLTKKHQIIYSLAQLNYPSLGALEIVEDEMLRINNSNYMMNRCFHLPWILAWYGIIHRQYPARLLERILNDSFLTGTIY